MQRSRWIKLIQSRNGGHTRLPYKLPCLTAYVTTRKVNRIPLYLPTGCVARISITQFLLPSTIFMSCKALMLHHFREVYGPINSQLDNNARLFCTESYPSRRESVRQINFCVGRILEIRNTSICACVCFKAISKINEIKAHLHLETLILWTIEK